MREFGWLQAVHPDDRERTGRLWVRAMIEKRTYENELRVRTRDGSYRHFYVHAVPILAPDGSLHEWVGANIDITERKQAEQALRDLVAGTGVIGEEFFPAYVRHVAAALDVHCASVAEVTDEQNSRLRTLAVWVGQRCEKNYEYEVADAPCGQVVRRRKALLLPGGGARAVSRMQVAGRSSVQSVTWEHRCLIQRGGSSAVSASLTTNLSMMNDAPDQYWKFSPPARRLK